MFYPLKFEPVFKDYIWGGRSLSEFGKTLPEGKVAESWEISCHPNGTSIISNGEFKGISLPDFIKKFGHQIIGNALPKEAVSKFPLLVKFIDANDKLSVQVHPDDAYANSYENGEFGKNEMWYIIKAKKGAKLVYGVKPGLTKELLTKLVEEDRIEEGMNFIEVSPGDVVNIPAGLVHAIGEGIILAEVQQNSDLTYRVFDYNRVDKDGNKRPLHIEKALDVIDYKEVQEKAKGLEIKIDTNSSKTYKIANNYFSIELLNIDGSIDENADGSKFVMYVIIEGDGQIEFESGITKVCQGESLLIPAAMGKYTLRGKLKILKAYVPDLERDVIEPLKKAGYKEKEILENVSGLK
jgi:mannose-6-phosphate isomerase